MNSFSSDSETTFKILAVCTGNICRSPMLERYLRSRLAGLTTVSIMSAGTLAQPGREMTDMARDLAAQNGGSADPHSSRQLEAQHISESDLVLALSREHRRDVVSLYPRASRYTFTLREFHRLSQALPALTGSPIQATKIGREPAELQDMVRSIAALRGTARPPQDPRDYDVVDPYRQPWQVYEESGNQLFPPAQALVELIVGP